MKQYLLRAILLFLLSQNLILAQEKNYTRHTVTKGENISQIAIKYNVTPHDIYQINPDAQNGIHENDVILIPNSSVAISQQTSPVDKPKAIAGRTHVAKPKETLYSIAREYNVNVEDLKALNASILSGGLKIGQTIKIPDSSGHSTPVQTTKVESAAVTPKPEPQKVVEKATESAKSDTQQASYHVVQPKETKFGIAKKYGLTVQELEQLNPAIVSNLPIGYKLNLTNGGKQEPAQPAKAPEKVVEKPKPVVTEIVKDEVVETKTIRTLTKNGYANYEVKQGDTMYSLSQYFKISTEELTELNPTLKEGVKEGMILKVPGRGTIKVDAGSPAVFKESVKKVVPNASKKQLVLLLPFNVAKIESDTTKTVDMRLKKDAFLNLTLDFYAGALVAIDSAKTLGLNVDVNILDSEESKMTSNIDNLIKDHKLDNADAVIGPFYQQYAERTADLLSAKKIPVISPLSKEEGKMYDNLFQSMPSADAGKKAIFDFMLSKNGNIIVVSDPKRIYNKEFISKKYPSAKFVNLMDNGSLDVANLKSLLVKGAQNFVVMESERTGLILGTTNVLLNELANFQIQLVIIEPNETLDFEEVSMKRLTILKLLYPSMTRENNSYSASLFEKKFKEANRIFPNQYATRGFDLTFDTLLRITQNASFESSVKDTQSEQVESRFDYRKSASSGYVNHGIYIMQYQDDLTVKQMN